MCRVDDRCEWSGMLPAIMMNEKYEEEEKVDNIGNKYADDKQES